MIRLHTLVASVAGIGYVKGGGTVAAMVFCIVWILLPAGYVNSNWQILTALAIVLLGTWSAGVMDGVWGKDSSRVVIDEVAGMAIALLFVPHQIGYLLLALVAFRFFDIAKPLGVRKAELLPKGWGVMADDVLAGLYALALTHACLWIAHKFG